MARTTVAGFLHPEVATYFLAGKSFPALVFWLVMYPRYAGNTAKYIGIRTYKG